MEQRNQQPSAASAITDLENVGLNANATTFEDKERGDSFNYGKNAPPYYEKLSPISKLGCAKKIFTIGLNQN